MTQDFTNPVTESERGRQMQNYYEGRTKWDFLSPLSATEVYKGYSLTREWWGYQGLNPEYTGPGDHVNLLTGNSITDLIEQIDEITENQTFR